jgi:hypothetical protein
MICKICGNNADTRNGICGNCLGNHTVKIRKKKDFRQSIVAVIVGIVILAGLILFVHSGTFEKTVVKASEVTDELEFEIKIIEQELENTSPLNVRAEARMLEYVNEIRAEKGIGNIREVNELTQIAHASSTFYAQKGEISAKHEIARKYDCANVGGQGTIGVAEVLTQEEVPLLYQINPENVGERFIDSWMGSDAGHREALLNPSYALGGFGVTSSLTVQYASGVFCPIQ